MAITGLQAAGTEVPRNCWESSYHQPVVHGNDPSAELSADFFYHYYLLRGETSWRCGMPSTKGAKLHREVGPVASNPFPSTGDEQSAIAAILFDMEAETAAMRKSSPKFAAQTGHDAGTADGQDPPGMTGRDRPICWIIAGPNGAGKTTFALKYLPEVGCQNFVNADLIAAGMSPLAPERERMSAGRLFLTEIRRHIQARHDFGFETTLAGRGYLRLIRRLHGVGLASGVDLSCPAEP